MSIDSRNPWLQIDGSFLSDFGQKRLVAYLGKDQSIAIPDGIETIGSSCFEQTKSIESIAFGPVARIRRIERLAFLRAELQSLTIPATVDAIEPGAFTACSIRVLALEPGNLFYRLRDRLLCTADGLCVVQYFGSESLVRIPAGIVTICESAFRSAATLATVEFERGSLLRSIARDAFRTSGLRSICLPASTALVDASAFRGCSIEVFKVEEGNSRFEVKWPFLLDRNGTRILGYFGGACEVVIPAQIHDIAPYSFSVPALPRVSFEADSRLMRLGPWAFTDTKIQALTLPPRVEIIHGTSLGASSLSVDAANPFFRVFGDFLVDHSGARLVRYLGESSHLCIPREIECLGPFSFWGNHRIDTVTFEAGSRLRVIERSAFESSSLNTISFPPSLEWISRAAFVLSTALESVVVDPANPHLTVLGDCLLSRASGTLVRVLTRDSHVLIPPEVSIIDSGALYSLPGVISVDFADPLSVHTICRAGLALPSLKSLRLPAGVRKIHALALYDVMIEAFSVDADHPHFRLDGECLIERAGDRLVCTFARRPTLSVPSAVRILGKWALGFRAAGPFAVAFPADSRLRSVEKFAFGYSAVVSLTIPSGVESIDGSAFDDSQLHTVAVAPGNANFAMRGDFLVAVPERRLVRYFGARSDVVVPGEIAVLGPACLSRCPHVASVSFPEGSELTAIEPRAMRGTDLAAFRIPKSVARIHGSAFGEATAAPITVDDGNPHFRVDGDFLLAADRRTLIRYFGRGSEVCIDSSIEVLAGGCFYAHPTLAHCRFAEGSRLRAVMERAFSHCCVWDVALPQGVRYIGERAFPPACHVSVRNLTGVERAQFAQWDRMRKDDPSVVLDLPVSQD
jgi:hypothetical protein